MAQVANTSGGGASGSTTGYNPTAVSGSINQVNNSYVMVLTELVAVNQSIFVSPMASKWGSPQAVTFFTAYKDVIDTLKNEITKVFTSVVESMNTAATALATIATSSWGTIDVADYGTELDVSCIKEALPDGTIGVDLEGATSLVEQLSTISSYVAQGLDMAVTAVGNSGFIGGGMQESLVTSINTIKGNIEQAFSDVTKDVTTAINDTVTAYTKTTTNISNAFAGGQG